MEPSYTIIMIENSANLRRLNRLTLNREIKDCLVLEAATLAEGRELLCRGQPDLLMLDVELTDGSGLDLCREIRRTSSVPILFVSGLGSPEDIRAGYEAGGDDYLKKPYQIETLAERVTALLRRIGRGVPDGQVDSPPANMD